jgi:hypothetical protein
MRDGFWRERSFALSEAQERRLLEVLRPPSQRAVIRYMNWSRTPSRDEAPEMGRGDFVALHMLARIEGDMKDFLIDMHYAETELPPATVRENLRDAARNLRRTVQLLRNSGEQGLEAAARCAEHMYEKKRFPITVGRHGGDGYHSLWPCPPISMASGGKLTDDLSDLASGLSSVVVHQYAALSKEDRKRQMAHAARVRLAAQLWRDYCGMSGVEPNKRTDHRFNELVHAVFDMADPQSPQDLRRLIGAGRKRARETGGYF